MLKLLQAGFFCTLVVVSSSFPQPVDSYAVLPNDETYCDEITQDNPITQFLFDASLLANYTIDQKLVDGTAFKDSTAYAIDLHVLAVPQTLTHSQLLQLLRSLRLAHCPKDVQANQRLAL